jgi:uncharacterized protein YfkK (UPF0435 family)
MVITTDSVLALAEKTNSLSQEQLRRIRDLVHFMNEEDLKMLYEMIEKVHQLDVREKKLLKQL